jgi:hypothetical protein
MPRSLSDFLITILIAAPLQLGGLFVVPAFASFAIFRSETLTLLVLIAIYFAFLTLSVWSITLSEDGIHFRRFLGSPKLLLWNEVVSIEVTPRWELIRKGWLWPLIPAREMTTSLTSLGHYRITWADGFAITRHWTLSFSKNMSQTFSKIVLPPNPTLKFAPCGRWDAPSGRAP